jgi:hypothetical protein
MVGKCGTFEEKEMYAEFWCRNLKENDNMKDIGMCWMTLEKYNFFGGGGLGMDQLAQGKDNFHMQ